jgi:hypothetical protein
MRLPTPFQRPFQRLPTPCVFHPPITPLALEGPSRRWKAPALPTPTKEVFLSWLLSQPASWQLKESYGRH